MADFKKTSGGTPIGPTEDLEAEADTRRRHGIERLSEDEELIDNATFAKMHVALAVGRESSGPSETELAETKPELGDELDELLLDEMTSAPTKNRRRDPGRQPYGKTPQSPAEVAALEAEIRGAVDRDSIARLTLRLARRFARVAAVLVVNRGIISGIRAEGEGLENRIEGVMLSASVEGLFSHVVEFGEPRRIIAPFDGFDARVLGAFSRRDARDVCVFPVLIRGRVVSLLYVDNGPDALAETSVAALGVLCEQVAIAYQRLILEKKNSPATGPDAG